MSSSDSEAQTPRTADYWPKIAVAGAGAVGGYFGGMLARAGAPVIFIGRPAFVDAVKHSGLFLDTVQFQERVKVNAATDLSAARGAEIILFCVKTTDTAETACELAKALTPDAVVISMQNGVDNAEQIEAASGFKALPAAVYVAASVPSPGTVKHVGRGDLVLGPKNKTTERVAAAFNRANVPCRISENLAGELWTKLVWNCALNAISALGKVTYGEIIASADTRQLLETAVYEVLAVAKASGVQPAGLEDPKAAVAGAYKIAQQMAATRSSTAQDMVRGKKTEIDSLNGFIARRGKELNIPVPINRTLFTLVKLAEESFAQAGVALK
jgi:2-dehydropantoate 2-reductase